MTNDWIDSLPTVPRDDPSVIEVPAAEHIEETHRAMATPSLGNVVERVQELSSEARALFMLHPAEIRGQLLSNPEAKNALSKLLWELAKDEKLGSELRKRNPTRYEPPQSLQAQS